MILVCFYNNNMKLLDFFNNSAKIPVLHYRQVSCLQEITFRIAEGGLLQSERLSPGV